MPLSRIGATVGTNSEVRTISVTSSPDGTPTLAIACFGVFTRPEGPLFSDLTYAGSSMSSVVNQNEDVGNVPEQDFIGGIFQMLSPPSGDQTTTLTLTGGVDTDVRHIALGITTYSGGGNRDAENSSSVGAAGDPDGTNTGGVITNTGGFVIDCLFKGFGPGEGLGIPGAQTVIFQPDPINSSRFLVTEASGTGGTVTMSETWSANASYIHAVASYSVLGFDGISFSVTGRSGESEGDIPFFPGFEAGVMPASFGGAIVPSPYQVFKNTLELDKIYKNLKVV